MKYYKYLLVGFMIVMILAACSPGMPEEVDLPLETELPPQVVEAQAWLANQLDVEQPEIEFRSVERVDWSDSCLGLGGPAESCLQAITPGWKIVFSLDGQEYEVRTDETGSSIRVVPNEESN